MAGVTPKEVAASVWGRIACRRARNTILGLATIGLAVHSLAIFVRLASGTPPLLPLLGAWIALAACILQWAIFQHHWLALFFAEFALRSERLRWGSRAHVGRVGEWISQRADSVAKEAMALLGIAVVGCCVALLLQSISAFVEAAGARAVDAILWLNEQIPSAGRPFAWIAAVGSALVHGMGWALRWSGRKRHERAIGHAEEMLRYWRESQETQAAAAAPRK